MKRPNEPARFAHEEFMTPVSPFAISEYPVDRYWSIHWHDYFEMEFILGGTGRQRMNGVPVPLRRGAFFLLTPSDFHEVEVDASDPLQLINIKFTDAMIESDVQRLIDGQRKPVHACFEGAAFADLEADLRRMMKEQKSELPGKKQVIAGTLQRVLIDLLRASEADAEASGGSEDGGKDSPGSGGSPGVAQTGLQRALLFVEHRFREPITLKQAAEQAELSPNYFSERFHAATGRSFQSYVLELRLGFAHRLLQGTPLPVTEIGYAAGFHSLPYFIRVFKRKYGMPPNGVRKGLQTDNSAVIRNRR